ncbi:DnaJ domain-containing protein [Arthrobacter sp. ISL-85]|uniref:DnaJ domain-containing protein n=1 Tax=Arthrobacter sp. ISL-85 TaxID=2819115 RepID=UPI001BE9538D|nr:DnaJ domain-containing protein [Arthrobacter sp. ISL-85]MBT2567806.1 DnaJ domain-containing protein [Arthrobacter sp. ISL-85]
MTHNPDYYAILGVSRDATRAEISHAYRALMRSHHPDMDGGQAGGGNGASGNQSATTDDPAQRDELLGIMQAFNVLHDSGRRADYDRRLAAGAPTTVPVRKVRSTGGTSGPPIRVTPVRWESGPWA